MTTTPTGRPLPPSTVDTRHFANATRRTPSPAAPGTASGHRSRFARNPDPAPTFYPGDKGSLFNLDAIPRKDSDAPAPKDREKRSTVPREARARTTADIATEARAPRKSIQERFDAWIDAHPEIEELYVRFARDVKRRGRTEYSIAAITERIRWHYDVERDDAENEPFKIANDYRSRMARFLMRKYDDLAGMFTTRELTEMSASEKEQHGEADGV